MQEFSTLHRVSLGKNFLRKDDQNSDIEIDSGNPKEITLIHTLSSSNKCPNKKRKQPKEDGDKSVFAKELHRRFSFEE